MSIAAYTLLILNLSFMGLLPRIFFRSDGRFNLMWWLTSAPFFLAAVLISLEYFHVMPAMVGPAFHPALEVVAVVLSVASVSLMCYTLGTHRRPLALWHQTNDAPQEIVTYGAYKHIRHPFYASFLLVLCATIVLCPSLWSAALGVYGLSILNFTAAREERKLANSAFGDNYRAYMRRSGRFFPRMKRTVQ